MDGKKEKIKVVYLQWLDACTSGEESWYRLKDVLEEKDTHLVRVESVGFIIKEDKDSIILCDTISEGDIGPYTAIPKSCIIKRKNLTF